MFQNEDGPLPLGDLMELLHQYTKEEEARNSNARHHTIWVGQAHRPIIVKVLLVNYAHRVSPIYDWLRDKFDLVNSINENVIFNNSFE